MDYLTLTDGLLISLSGITIVLVILALVVLLLQGLGHVIARMEKPAPLPVSALDTPPPPLPPFSLAITDEERVIVALVAGIAAEEEDPQGHYHIGRITRTR